MRIAAGTVVNGRVVLEGELPEGARVTVLVEDQPGQYFEVDAGGEAELLAALADVRSGRFEDGRQLLRDIRG
jgi:hypothetical protein